ncbi:MAG TPA: 16S rRNA (adenine(1518)-N(6)/adenine(1519)-N(6))-dimethyltransferase RsmA [Thermomicrobiaceae bacterium]|nr:16S rRNA (adenine(1518)-N(6)/adenine(1519)-N(6))-dimethyltransferase RsmA [Thermomicrobiaceae bacterium]
MTNDDPGRISSGHPWPHAPGREVLERLGVRPSKALGQNFLHDPKIVRRIADEADPAPTDLVVEVGPGLGILTAELARRAERVVAVELDHRLAEYLRDAFSDPPVHVVGADILTVDLHLLTSGRPYTVVANLPYSVAAAAIERLLEADRPPIALVVMVQREVAKRIVARPPDMSVLAVAVQFHGRPRIVFRLGPGAFFPPPKVDSAVLRIDVNPEPRLTGERRLAFFRLVRAGFSQRRKRLANAIAASLDSPKPDVEQRLRAVGIDPDRRAETLTVEDWLAVERGLGALTRAAH